MRIMLIAVSLPLMLAATERTPPPKKAPVARIICAPKLPTLVGATTATPDVAPPPTVRPLGAMPPAKQQLAVIRTVDGCGVPTVIRDNIGGR